MKRRRFLVTTAAGAAVVAGGGTGWLVRPRTRAELLGQPDLLHLLGDADRVRAIGRAYRAAFPEEGTAAELTRRLLRDQGPAARLSDGLLSRRVASNVRRDFDREDTVQLGGWILSRTEARQSALYSILYP
jgi:hypothetical protein